jgi:hypothetical protein
MDFKTYLKEEVGLEDPIIERLLDAGFDDVESLELIGE